MTTYSAQALEALCVQDFSGEFSEEQFIAFLTERNLLGSFVWDEDNGQVFWEDIFIDFPIKYKWVPYNGVKRGFIIRLINEHYEHDNWAEDAFGIISTHMDIPLLGENFVLLPGGHISLKEELFIMDHTFSWVYEKGLDFYESEAQLKKAEELFESGYRIFIKGNNDIVIITPGEVEFHIPGYFRYRYYNANAKAIFLSKEYKKMGLNYNKPEDKFIFHLLWYISFEESPYSH